MDWTNYENNTVDKNSDIVNFHFASLCLMKAFRFDDTVSCCSSSGTQEVM